VLKLDTVNRRVAITSEREPGQDRHAAINAVRGSGTADRRRRGMYHMVLIERTFRQMVKVEGAASAEDAARLAKNRSLHECNEPDSEDVDVIDVWEEHEDE
jgi:hypothetical protein